MHEDFKTAPKTKIHHSIVLSWKPRISWKNRHFLAFKYEGVSIPVKQPCYYLHCILICNIYKPCHIKKYIVQNHIKIEVKGFKVRIC